ncbi:hypothetical protein [Pseudomonas sp. LRF_L74]|uniref:hypothetical protein n=1 Tax=Pseudomonas sp. LRF_L74 TaxID=3369422 RepID=UPI003F6210C5
MKLLAVVLPLTLGSGLGGSLVLAPQTSDPLRSAYLVSSLRVPCLSGERYLNNGDSQAAATVFEDCVKRWDDIYSMLQLARLYQDSQPRRASEMLSRAQNQSPAQTAYWQARLSSDERSTVR